MMRLPLLLGAVLHVLLLPTGAAVLVGCANGPPPTPELARFDLQQGYRFTQTARGADNTSGLLVVLIFSGGGTRAAALAHGILEELAGIEIEWEGRRRRLLDEVDSISAVSGGSVTAAYYALYGDGCSPTSSSASCTATSKPTSRGDRSTPPIGRACVRPVRGAPTCWPTCLAD